MLPMQLNGGWRQMVDTLYKPFLEATRNVFQLMLDLPNVTASTAEAFQCDDEIDVSIGVTGDLVGEVIYRFPNDTSLNMVKIMSGMEIESIDDFVTSAISEIANIISGNVLTMLAGENMRLILRNMNMTRKKRFKFCVWIP